MPHVRPSDVDFDYLQTPDNKWGRKRFSWWSFLLPLHTKRLLVPWRTLSRWRGRVWTIAAQLRCQQSPHSTINSIFLFLIQCVKVPLSSLNEKRSYSHTQLCWIMSKAFKDTQEISLSISNWIIQRNWFNWALKLDFKSEGLISFCHVLRKSADCVIKYKWRFERIYRQEPLITSDSFSDPNRSSKCEEYMACQMLALFLLFSQTVGTFLMHNHR